MNKKIINFVLVLFIATLLTATNTETGNALPTGINLEIMNSAENYIADYYSQKGLGEWTGEGPWGGIVREIYTDPNDGDLVFAACGLGMASETGSVWKSTDGGLTWNATELSGKPFYGLTSAADQPGVFYASAKNGFYKSTDYGESWDMISGSSTFYIKLGANLVDGDIVIGGLSGNAGFKRSTDGGETWNDVGMNAGFLKSVVTAPSETNVMYAAMGGDAASSVYKSTDSGASWEAIGPTPAGDDNAAYTIYVSDTNSSLVIIMHDDGIFKSTDGGDTWNLQDTASGGGGDLVEYNGNLYCGIWGQGVYESTDDGDTWTVNPNAGVMNYWQAGAASNQGVLMGYWGGINRGSGTGETWEFTDEGINAAFVNALAYYSDRGELWAGTQGSGLFCSTDGGQTWTRKINGLGNIWIYDIAPQDHLNHEVDRMIVSTENAAYLSDNYGDDWSLTALDGSTVTDATIDWTDPDKFWVAGVMGPVQGTTDGGSSWTEGTGLPFGLYPKLTLGENGSGDQRVFCCYENGYGTSVYYSDDSGATYETATGMDGTTYHPMMSVRLPQDGMDQLIYCTTDQGIYKSEDNGESFTILDGITGLFWSINASMGTDVYAGAGSGVYHSPDNGDTWEEMNEGIENNTIYRVLYGDDENTLYISTRGRGVMNYQIDAGALETPANFNVTGLGEATWTAPEDENVLSYNIYLDEGLVDNTTNTEYVYADLTEGVTYTAGVSAVYDEGESAIVTDEFTYQPPSFNPPENLVASLDNYNDVNLTWEQPSGTGGTLSYQGGYNGNGIGTDGAAEFSCAARFTSEELEDFYGGNLSQVNIVIASADFSNVTLKVWEGGSFGDSGTEVYSQDITSDIVVGDWTNHVLNSPINLVSGNEYWIGYAISATADHPAAVDDGPMVPDKGAWMYFNNAWDLLPNIASTLDYNWCIEGIVGGKDTILTIDHQNITEINYSTTRNSNFEMKTHPVINSRSLSGYKIYRDGSEITEITDPNILEYSDTAMAAGNYEYYVTALYDGEESEASNLETVEVALPTPANFSAISQAPSSTNILCTWDAPAKERGLTHYNLYRDGEVVGTPTNTLYVDANVPDGTYEYYATAVYSDEYESDATDTITVQHYTSSNDNPNVPAVTTLLGNYPNPFNPSTTIEFALANPSKVSLDIFNVKGEKITTLLNKNMTAANHSIVWNGKDNNNQKVSSGIYYYRLQTKEYSHIKKMILMK
jgi:photosystem II stability/assembly factor-like uncharacterized protein